MAEKRDHLKECNEFKLPLEEFGAQFCSRCFQPECMRSQHGRSRFESRVQDWEQRMFLDVPRMEPEDPRFKDFQAKRFLDINTSGPLEVQGWVDPSDLSRDTDRPLEDVLDPTDPAPAPDPTDPAPPPDMPTAAPDPEELSPEVAIPASPPMPQGLMNTPAQPKMMVGGKKVDPKQGQPVFDQWEPQKTETDGLQVVKPGAKIRLGS